jgi:Uma2 family endonuclease
MEPVGTVIQKHLTLEEFHRFEHSRTDGPRYEYWFGKAVPKAMPTWLHSTLQRLLTDLLESLGYYTAVELALRILPAWHPKPDVAAATFREHPYPTKPIEIVAEVLSPADEPRAVNEKCQLYEQSGIGQIYVFDPEKRTAKLWSSQLDRLVDIEALRLPNGVVYPVKEIWTELDRRLSS